MKGVDVLTLAIGLATIGVFLRTVLSKSRDTERYEEDDARAFVEEHGHWPDETPEEADARRRRAAEAERIARSSYRGG